MENRALIKSIDNLASDLVFLDGREIDIPSSGRFMNHLDDIIKAAEPFNNRPANPCGHGFESYMNISYSGAQVICGHHLRRQS